MRQTKEKCYEIDMCNGPILKKMLLFAIPLMFSSILQILFNAADIIVVGRFAGEHALAAVGSNAPLIGLFTNIFIGLAIGSNVLAARYYGAKEQEKLSKTVHTSILISIYSGMLLTVIGVLGAKRLLIWVQTPEEVLGLATLYLRIYFLGMTAMMLYNFGSALLRSIGDTKRPLYYLLSAGIVNVILNLILVLGVKLGVAGVAIATIVSQAISAYLVMRCLIKEKGAIRLIREELRIDRATLKNILVIGLPAGIQGILFSLSNVVIQSSVNSFGATVMAGASAAANFEQFVFCSMNAFHHATVSFISQNMGGKNFKRIYKIFFTGLGCVLVVGVILGNLVAFNSRELLAIYSPKPEVIAEGAKRLLIIATMHALCGMMDVTVGALRGIGYSILPMIISIIGVCGVRLVWIATVFQIEEFHRIETVYLSYPISWIITFAIQLVCFLINMKRIQNKPSS